MKNVRVVDSCIVRNSIKDKQSCIELFENIDNSHLVFALNQEDKIAVLQYAVLSEDDERESWLLPEWIDKDYMKVVDGWTPEEAVKSIPSRMVRRLQIQSVHHYLEQLERSFGKQLSDYPKRQAEFDLLWNQCARSVVYNEVYEDVETYVDNFFADFTSSVYLEESTINVYPSEAYICNNDIMCPKGTSVQVDGIFQDSADFFDQDSSSDYLLEDTYSSYGSSLLAVDIHNSSNGNISNNDETDEKGTFVQVGGRKWRLGTDFFTDESMMCQIKYRCKKVKADYDSMEDMVAEAFVQYVQMKEDGLITREKPAAYYAESAVNRMIDKYKYDNRQKRRSVDTVSLFEPSFVDVEDDYGSFEEWYESLNKTQKSAVDDAQYKVEKEQSMGNTLRKRLRRVPKPVLGTSVQRFGSNDLREVYAYMRPEQHPEPGEVKIIKQETWKQKAKPTKLLEMIENGVSSKDLQMLIATSQYRLEQPENAGEGKDMPNEVKKPTVVTTAIQLSLTEDPYLQWWNYIVSQKQETLHLIDADEATRTEHMDSEQISAILYGLFTDQEYRNKVVEWKRLLLDKLDSDKLMEYKRSIKGTRKPGEDEELFLTKSMEISW